MGYRPNQIRPQSGNLNFAGLARLRPGISIERARAELIAVQAAIDAELGGPKSWQIGPVVVPLQQRLIGDIRQSLVVFMAAVGAVLLVLCVNLANLSLSRTAGRAREAAICTALGAGRWDLARQSLAGDRCPRRAGGALGIAAYAWTNCFSLAAAPIDSPWLSDVSIDGRVPAFAIAFPPSLHSCSAFCRPCAAPRAIRPMRP